MLKVGSRISTSAAVPAGTLPYWGCLRSVRHNPLLRRSLRPHQHCHWRLRLRWTPERPLHTPEPTATSTPEPTVTAAPEPTATSTPDANRYPNAGTDGYA